MFKINITTNDKRCYDIYSEKSTLLHSAVSSRPRPLRITPGIDLFNVTSSQLLVELFSHAALLCET